MKKSIWIVLPILIIAIVLVAVFIGQRNTLSDQVAQLQSEKTALSKLLNESDIAAKTAQELADKSNADADEKLQEAEARILKAEERAQEAENRIAAAETKAQEAESKVQETQETVEALSLLNAERDAQLADAVEQLQNALKALGIGNTDAAKAVAVVLDADQNVVLEYDVSELKTDAAYTVSILIYDAAGEEAARYDLP